MGGVLVWLCSCCQNPFCNTQAIEYSSIPSRMLTLVHEYGLPLLESCNFAKKSYLCSLYQQPKVTWLYTNMMGDLSFFRMIALRLFIQFSSFLSVFFSPCETFSIHFTCDLVPKRFCTLSFFECISLTGITQINSRPPNLV